jgi:dTDP-4-amino-4,6-dideoxygalactose transaminase
MIWRCDLVPQYEAYREEIHEAIGRVLKTGRYILANEVAAFEKEFADYIGVKHGVGVANATDGLTLALMALGVGPGDEVITTPFTAIPTGSAIVDSGAKSVFVDICEDTFLMDLDKVAAAITPRTKAVMPVHIFGNVLDVPRLRKIVPAHIPIIEDASQAHGSTLGGHRAGSFADAAVFSFYPTKNLGGYGDGGMVVTNSTDLDKKLRLLRMYGMTDKDHTVTRGVNSRLDELQAAILSVKLKHLEAMNHRRNEIAKRFQHELDPRFFVHQRILDGVISNYHVFACRFRGDRAKFVAAMDAREIQTNIYYVLPLHLQEAHKASGQRIGSLPVSEAVCSEALALTMYPELSDETLTTVIGAANECARML